jgi:hypothetical protein
VQFTPDLLPSDITGTHVSDERTGEFEFSEGPVFANVVLADGINRAPPKTQAALLEAMEEGQVSADGETRPLPEPFFVVATQNPVEQEGTFRLPRRRSTGSASRRRWATRTARANSNSSTAGPPATPGRRPPTAFDPATLRDLQAMPERVQVHDSIREYVVDLGRATREDDRVEVGVCPRGVQRSLGSPGAHPDDANVEVDEANPENAVETDAGGDDADGDIGLGHVDFDGAVAALVTLLVVLAGSLLAGTAAGRAGATVVDALVVLGVFGYSLFGLLVPGIGLAGLGGAAVSCRVSCRMVARVGG